MRLVLTTLLCTLSFAAFSAPEKVVSPDGRLVIVFEDMTWGIVWDGNTILEPSVLDLELAGQAPLSEGATVQDVTRRSVDQMWTPVLGERSSIRDHFNEMAITLRRAAGFPRYYTVTIRAYDEGAAVAYTIPEQEASESFTVQRERTQFRFSEDYLGYAVYSAQGLYEAVPLSAVRENCERPMTIEMGQDQYAAIAEARLVDYARMRLRPSPGVDYALEAHLAGTVKAEKSLTTPWRVVMVGKTPGALLEQNYLILNLNDPCVIEDTSWIKPGTVIREVTLTNGGAKACVDFAVSQGLDYIHLDAGWYGHEYDAEQDATTVTVDPKRNPDSDLDIHEVIRYAESKGIGVWVYVNQRHLSKQLDEILPLYKAWGLKGIKYGFVNVGSQEATTWLHEAIRKAAEHELMVDVHDEYRMTGVERTYPNLLTVEGIRGNEEMPPPESNLTLPFTRMLCGAGDYTICWYTTRIKTTHAHQLAAAIVFYSPLEFLYWYDKPAQYQNEPETAFFRNLPTTWDETRVLRGKIGHYITMARRKGATWYLVSMNAQAQRSLDIPLDFLEEGMSYEAFISADTYPEGGDPFAVTVSEKVLSRADSLRATMAANGGYAVKLTPKK